MIIGIVAPAVPYLAVAIGLLLWHNAWIAIAGYHAGILIVLMTSATKFHPGDLFRSNNWKIPAAAALMGIVSGVLVYFFLPTIVTSAGLDQYLVKIGLTPAVLPFFMLYFFLVNPFLEEYYWRGFLSSQSKRLTLNDLLFSGYHILVLAAFMSLIWLIIIFIALAAGAWLWRQANRLSHGLLPSTVSHLATDFSIMLAVFLILR